MGAFATAALCATLSSPEQEVMQPGHSVRSASLASRAEASGDASHALRARTWLG